MTDRYPEFYKDNPMRDKGDEAEAIVEKWYKGMSSVDRVKRLTQDWDNQDAEIDFTVYLKGGGKTSVEVKSDKHLGVRNKNVLFEFTRVYNTDFHPFRLAWGPKSKADEFVFYASKPKHLYVYNVKKLNTEIAKIIHDIGKSDKKYKEKTAEIKAMVDVVITDKAKITFNLLVPEVLLKSITTKYNLNAQNQYQAIKC